MNARQDILVYFVWTIKKKQLLNVYTIQITMTCSSPMFFSSQTVCNFGVSWFQTSHITCDSRLDLTWRMPGHLKWQEGGQRVEGFFDGLDLGWSTIWRDNLQTTVKPWWFVFKYIYSYPYINWN